MSKDWKYYFYEISKIPRKSGHEEKIKNYLIEFANKRNLKYYTDENNNVIIWKNSSKDSKCKETIGFQAHVDMVCEKNNDSNHNFLEDSLELIEENGFIKAKDTSLGADNGIGVAYILAILDSTSILHPNIEAIFTTQEETTMDGVRNLDENKINSKKIISFDNFNENEIWISSASSQEWYTEMEPEIIQKEDVKTYELRLKNFIGGHAGMDIGDEDRGNPIKVAFEILKNKKVFINSVKSGSLINVIPCNCEIIFSIEDKNELFEILKNIQKMKLKYNNQIIELNEIEKNINMMNLNESKNLINCINDFQIGAINRDENNNVVVGSNLAKVDFDENIININFCVRGNRRILTDKYIESLKENIINKYELKIRKYDEWKGYEQPLDNELIKVCEQIYLKQKNKKPNILGVQACLECEFLGLKIKDLQYVAIGTNTYDVHSVNERLDIDSACETWEFIVNILKIYCGGIEYE